jgi:hypothetical protein
MQTYRWTGKVTEVYEKLKENDRAQDIGNI